MVDDATSSDPDLQRVLQYVLHGWPSSKLEDASELWTFFDVQSEPVLDAVFFEAAVLSFQLRCVDSCWYLHTRDIRASVT